MTTMPAGNEPTHGGTPPPRVDPTGKDRAEARKRVEAKRALTGHVVAYVVVNAFLVGVWAVTGRGYFWPGWVLAGWGIGLVLNVWDVYWRRPITDADVDAELRRRR